MPTITAPLTWAEHHLDGFGTVHTAGPYMIRRRPSSGRWVLVDYTLDPPAWHPVDNVPNARGLAATTPDPICRNHGPMTLLEHGDGARDPLGRDNTGVWLCHDHTEGCPLHYVPADVAARIAGYATDLPLTPWPTHA